jgi:hypothetical protein
MDRSYRAAETVAVYATQQDKDTGSVLYTFKAVPYSRHGLDYYQHNDGLYAGYYHPRYDACIILNQALKGVIE